MKRSTYFSSFMKILDFRACFSSIEEKEEMCELMIEREKIKEEYFQLKIKKYPNIEMCLRYIISHYLSESYDNFDDVLSIGITNMMLLEAYSFEELFQVFNQVSNLKENPIKMMKLLSDFFASSFGFVKS